LLDNNRDTASKGRCKPSRGEKNPNVKLTAEQAREIKESVGLTFRQLADKYGICPQQAHRVKVGLRWKHIKAAAQGE